MLIPTIIIFLQFLCVYHAFRRGADRWWIMIILIFPVLGCLIYIITEIVPQFTSSITGKHLKKKIIKTIDPSRELVALRNLVEKIPTVQNFQNLAQYYVDNRLNQEALDLLTNKFNNTHYSNDPSFLLIKATASFNLQQYKKAIDFLDILKQHAPDFKLTDIQLLYTKAQNAQANI
ncbi:MAG: hypothetical protein ABSA84_05680 [Gammaproteobacteria bacterium]|jgi:hypothetical protein